MSLLGSIKKERSLLKRQLSREKAKIQELENNPVIQGRKDWDVHLSTNRQSPEKVLIFKYIQITRTVRHLENKIRRLNREQKEFNKMKDFISDTKDHAEFSQENIIRRPRRWIVL
jgi:hypothetical protein